MPALGQNLTLNHNKTAADFRGTWTGASCLSTQPRFEQFVVDVDNSGNLTVTMQFLKDDGTITDPTNADTAEVDDGILVFKFVARDDPNTSLTFGVAYFQESPNDQIGGYAILHTNTTVKDQIPTVLQHAGGSIQDFANANKNICSNGGQQ